MKKAFGVISTILFFIGIASYVAMLFWDFRFVLISIIASLIGFCLALFAEKDEYRRIGLIGNTIIIAAVVIPYIIRHFIWTGP